VVKTNNTTQHQRGEERGLYSSISEMHSLAHAVHDPLRGDSEGVQLVSTEEEDGGEHGGKARVMLNLASKNSTQIPIQTR
jgi:hypothetical protein